MVECWLLNAGFKLQDYALVRFDARFFTWFCWDLFSLWFFYLSCMIMDMELFVILPGVAFELQDVGRIHLDCSNLAWPISWFK